MEPGIEPRGQVEKTRLASKEQYHALSQEDVVHAYGLHVNCYISKPVDFEQFANVVRAIDQFWFTVVTLPTDATNG